MGLRLRHDILTSDFLELRLFRDAASRPFALAPITCGGKE